MIFNKLDEIKKLYAEGFTHKQIAEKLGSSKSRIGEICLNNGFKKSILHPTEYQMQILYGSIIGDGSLHKPTPNSKAKFSLGHSLKQEQYFMLKYNAMYSILNCKTRLNFNVDKRTNKQYPSIHFQTRVNDLFNDLHKIWYRDGKKILPIDELMKLNDIALAIKFYDDGYKNSNGNYGISMNNYNLSCIENFSKWLFLKFGIESKIHTESCIYIPARCKDKFKSIVSCIQSPDVMYKL